MTTTSTSDVLGPAIGLRVPPCRPAVEVAAFARHVEGLGFDRVYFPDSQLLWRDPYLTMFAAASATSDLVLGTAVTNVVTRHPSVVAGVVRSVAEAAPGRVHLGLGVGNSSVEPIGLRPSRQAELRDGIAQIRGLLSGADVQVNGCIARQRDAHPGVPVYVAASGPQNLGLAGAIGDGAILLSGVSPALLDRGVSLVRQGATDAGRDPASVDLVVSAYAMVTDDVERDARILKPVLAGMAQHGARAVLETVGIHADVPAQVPEIYPDLVHAEDWSLAVEHCSRWISDADAVRYAEEFCLFGSAEHIAERIRDARARGASTLYLQHVGSYDLPERLAEDIAGRVLPLLAA
ncbi:LLM class flavin-dependent oxidoreductase [Nocardioides sp. YIM 152315]|uniref:LLM class flavin-dependent oxidoreductase n=1 Tax=Nocardioides sp. YIM 152315 TaxID=3031760 RepID=UPI0023DBFCFB|nr:LLM class flavin-dependent oxidoreductase [Nocardioides sp. YIM 152315]MDF1604513.1 LLM class flavin-dependent oxidoreductase [Nocardioides sp. YIM 152315]